MADKVMRMTGMKIVINHYLSLQFQPRSANAHTAKQKEHEMQRKEQNSKETDAGTGLENYVSSIGHGGNLMPKEVRNFL
jgi:hypothetical protein